MTVAEAIEKANSIAYSDYHINAGTDRKAVSKKGDNGTVIRIACYTLNGKYKGNYKCGCIDECGNYSVGQYDEVNLETMTYIGR